MVYTIQDLIKLAVKFPIRRLYIKRRNEAGEYEANWQRIDIIDGITRINNWGSVNIKIDADQISINNFEVSTYNARLMNRDGAFNSNADYRSFFFGFLDHKDTKIKLDVAMRDPDGVEVGTITAFEGLIDKITASGDNTAQIKAYDYSKKLRDFPFSDTGIVTNQTVSAIVNAIFAEAGVTALFTDTEILPAMDITLVTTTDPVFRKSMWDVLKYCAEKSQSTMFAHNDKFYFGTREVVGTTPDFIFAGLGNLQTDRTITIYDKPKYDQAGADKLYTVIQDTDSTLVAASVDPIVRATGKTISLDLSSFATAGERQDILDSYLEQWGVRRPSLSFKAPFMMMLLFPLDLFAIDSPGSKTEINSGYYDSSLWDNNQVYDGDGSSSSISVNERFIIESITYDVHGWETNIFGRKKV